MKKTDIPLRGFKGLKAHFKDDLISGFSVSLIALPLCLGISIASGFPPLAGLITAIIGGILASRISGSFVTISGPAAGLIVISLGAVETLGAGDANAGYAYALAAIVVAGVMMAVFGFLKVGKLGDFFPSAVVHGMLAAIGVIIIVKQLFVALGTSSPKGEIIHAFGDIPDAFLNLNPSIAIISIVSLLILIFHPKIKNRLIKMVPAPMWVLIFTIPLAHLFDLFELHTYEFMGKTFEVGPRFLVKLPENVMDSITFPDFGKIATGAFWISVISFALVSTIESLLSAKAVDSIDHYHRKSNLDKDITAMGAGSSVAALIGGLPMISEIVRSSANINNGGKTQWANFFHGTFLLIFVLFGKSIIEQIPLAALASMLVFTGFKLAAPKEFMHVLEIGRAQLAIFVMTLVVVLLTDLLIGVAVGILFKMAIHVMHGAPVKSTFKPIIEIQQGPLRTYIKVKKASVFSNYLHLKKLINKYISDGHDVIVDFTECTLVDHSTIHNLRELEQTLSEQNLHLIEIGLNQLNPVTTHPMATRLGAKSGSIFSKVKVSKRQQLMMNFAQKNDLEYTIEQIRGLPKWKAFDFAKSTRVKSVKNRLTGFMKNSVINIADVTFVEGAQISEKEHKITIMKIKPELDNFPSFSLEKEQYFEQIIAGWKDINFESHPVFSKFYYLKSQEETKVRTFFTEDLLSFFEQHQGFHIQSDGKQFLVYELDKFLEEGDLLLLMELAKGFDSIIHKDFSYE